MLHINGLTYRIGDRVLLDNATVAIPAGHKVGIVGRNGTGKSTLLRLIMGELEAEGGEINIHPRATVRMVAQEAPDGPQSLLDTVLAADPELTRLEAAARTETDPHRLAEIHTRLADIDAAAAPARAGAILSGLGFDAEAQARACQTFSGGWRMRVALACALFTAPDLLLLDEPTNYLDLEGVMWLETFLKTYPRTVLVVSHDRDLLNSGVGHILHLWHGRLSLYTGGYDRFEARRAEAAEQQAQFKAKRDAERRRLQAFVDRFRAKASKARQAQSRLKMLERLKPVQGIIEDETTPFTFPKPEPLSPPIVALEDAAAGYEADRPVLKRLNLRIDMDDRIALLGKNGNGKSTFAKLLSRRLKPMDGRITTPKTLKVGYFAQHQLDELRPKATPYDHMRELMPEHPEARVRARLGAFGFSADKADRAVETLSGGEKARLLFSLMAFNAPQLMILDEPTNHLDIDSRAALMEAINAYEGAVLLISHDRYLLQACADRLWVAEGGAVQPFDGDLDDYRAQLLDRRSGGGRKTGSPRHAARRKSAEARTRLAPLKKRVAEAEAEHARLTAKREKVEKALASPKLYDGSDPQADKKAAILRGEALQLKQAEDAAEEAWLDALEALEAAEADTVA
ncbi:glycosyl transferase family 1 [Rhodothalassium salexigens]|uniref:ABC-F family ATP-binding cassette domain-containing protein n=1 Tax=Rhodothalassium salexigens TaxID=1086 RepID=UPI001911499B|nr:ABC-F family ATP-binding cassette domain-containing protein [Rhodothalassium salexigens]MBK5911842.1 glycosyl transferase family 1 [Rhodothalassium salexigens]MBK5922060.1 glycosyl transferase family 1 [Rhodothalassium salexigens]